MNPLKHLRRYFVPGKHNQFKPHFFRAVPVLATAGIIGFLFFIALALNTLVIRSGSSQLGAVVSSTLVELTNTDRTANNLEGLTVNPVLQKAAQMKADDMAAKGYFAHNSPDGLTPWHWFEQAGYSFAFAGENLAVYFSDSAELEKAWMNSPLHRANILNSYFTEIGVATAKGVYQGRETVYVVQEFGRPKRGAVAAAVKTAAEGATKNIEKIPAEAKAPKIALKEIKNEAPAVKGAASNEDMFIAVENTSGEHDNTEDNSEIFKIAEASSVSAGTSAPTILKAAASPWTLLRTVYGFMGLFIALALMLMIGIEIKRQHPRHIAYGVSLLVLMGILLYSWQGFFFGKLLVI